MRVRAYICACMCTCACACIGVCVRVCVCMCVHVCVCMCMCVKEAKEHDLHLCHGWRAQARKLSPFWNQQMGFLCQPGLCHATSCSSPSITANWPRPLALLASGRAFTCPPLGAPPASEGVLLSFPFPQEQTGTQGQGAHGPTRC